MRRQILTQRFRFRRDLSELELAGVRGAFRDGLAKLLLRGLPKTRQFSDAPLFARLLQLLDRAYPELIVKRSYLFSAEAGQGKHFHNSAREFRAQLFEVFE